VNGRAEAPEFSVLTPAYNSAAYLAETISSVLAQTFESFEMLIVDDGSTDRTAEIADEFARQDPRIRVFRQANAGAAAARNRGIRASRGRYFALIDGDDCWMPNFLEAQRTLLQDHPELGVISANAINMGGELDGQPWKPVSDALTRVSLIEMLEEETSLCITAVFRREVAERLGGFDETLRNNEDYDLWLRAALAGYGCAFYSRPLAHYRRRPDSQSGDEQRTLIGILCVLERARVHCAERPDALALVERNIPRFEHRLLVAGAKSALLRGDYKTAAAAFKKLQQHHGPIYGVMASLTRHAPQLVLWAYAAKSSIAPRLASFRPRQ
jgi:GT2 family glycosyltransferase